VEKITPSGAKLKLKKRGKKMDAFTILKQNIVIDCHLDLLYDVLQKRRQGRCHVILDDYLADWRAGHVACIVSSLYCDESSDYLAEALQQLAAWEEELAESNGEFFLATCGADIRRAFATGKVAIMLSFEGVEPLVGKVGYLRLFHRLGLRFIGLCWSRGNWAADGSRFEDPNHKGYGLTEGGKQLLTLAHELQMLLDISHINDLGFWQVLNKTRQPVLASHSNSRVVSNTPRNLDDRQIAAIAQSGGVICINGVSLIAHMQDPASADLQTLVHHMQHIKAIAGAACLGLGLDQCQRIEAALPSLLQDNMFDIIPCYAQLVDLVAALIQADFTEEEIRGILGGNLLRVIESVIG
jgi:membrane dipeptidase